MRSCAAKANKIVASNETQTVRSFSEHVCSEQATGQAAYDIDHLL
jgi:hypothetical protein